MDVVERKLNGSYTTPTKEELACPSQASSQNTSTLCTDTDTDTDKAIYNDSSSRVLDSDESTATSPGSSNDSDNFKSEPVPQLAERETSDSSQSDYQDLFELDNVSGNGSECLDMDQIERIREDITYTEDEGQDEELFKDDEESSSDVEDEQARWDRISRTVRKMKMLLMKYPRFASRVGNNNIITSMHAMMDTLEDKPTGEKPTALDLKMVEEQMENFKACLFAGIEQDLEKWKSRKKSFRHFLFQTFAIIALFLTAAFGTALFS